MRNQHVIYSNSRVFESCSESQSPASQDENHGSREVFHKVFQDKHELMKCQNNLDQSTVKNISASDKILTSKSSDYEGYKNQEEQNRCCGKINTVLDYGKYTGKCGEAHLFCCGIKCYYFIMDNKHWNDCKKTCKSCSLSLMKTDDDDELSHRVRPVRMRLTVLERFATKVSALLLGTVNTRHCKLSDDYRLITVFQCSQEKYDRNNLYQIIRQNITSLNKTLTNESPEYEDCKYEKEQKRCCGKTNAVLDYGKYTGKEAQRAQLRIQVVFICEQIWVPLSLLTECGSFQDLMKLKLLKENGGCACLSFRGIHEGDCATKHPCICKKRMDRFPDSVYSLKRK
ncbi:hypothetical protein ACRRTK_006056 [Alexandromys fortis]